MIWEASEMRTISKFVLLLCIINSILTANQSKHPYAGSWSTATVQANNVTEYKFTSKIASSGGRGTEVNYHVFYPTQLKRYRGPVPTLVWLHGSFSSLKGIKPLSTYFQRAIDEGKLKPMAVVFPHGLNQSLWVNSKDGKYPVEDVLINELLPDLKNHFNYRPDRIKPMIAGFSMGGYGAARLGLKYSNLFSSIIAIAAGPLDENFRTLESNSESRDLLLQHVFGGSMQYYRRVNPRGEALEFSKNTYGKEKLNLHIICGDKDFTVGHNQRFAEYLTEIGIKHKYTMLPGVDHNMQQVFQTGSDQIFDSLNQQISSSTRKLSKKRNQLRNKRGRQSRRLSMGRRGSN